jgi:putative integral membrane protein (TIGR02587 family)
LVLQSPVHPKAPTRGESLREYGRGLAGGLIFSLPLLYTMEVWWTGFNAQPERLLAYVAFVFLLLLGYNRFAGIRHDASWIEVVVDSVEEFGLGVLTSAGMLYLLGRISSAQSFEEIAGKVIIEAGIVAIGFSVGTAQLGAGDDENDTGSEGASQQSFSSQLVIALCGAVLFAANVAPTEEVAVIAFEASSIRLLGLVVLSIALGSLILYFTAFARADRLAPVESGHQIARGSVITYAVALFASGAILWLFGQFDGDGVGVCLREIVVLGLPASLGASAGRLLLQS